MRPSAKDHRMTWCIHRPQGSPALWQGMRSPAEHAPPCTLQHTAGEGTSCTCIADISRAHFAGTRAEVVQGMSAAAMQSQVQQLLAGLAETESTQQGSAQQPAAAQQSVNGPAVLAAPSQQACAANESTLQGSAEQPSVAQQSINGPAVTPAPSQQPCPAPTLGSAAGRTLARPTPALQLLLPPQPMMAPFLPAGESHALVMAVVTTHARPATALQLPQPIAASVAPAEESHARSTVAQGVARSPATSLQLPQPVTALLAPAGESHARGIAAQWVASKPARALQLPAPLDAIVAPVRESQAPGTAAGVRTRSALTGMAAAPAEENRILQAGCQLGVQNMPRVPPPTWHAMQPAAEAATEAVQHAQHAAGQLDVPAPHAAVAPGDHQRSAESRRSQASMDDAGSGWISPNLVAREALSPSAETALVEAGSISSLGNPAPAAQGPAADEARRETVSGDMGLSVPPPLAASSHTVSEDGAGPTTHPANHRAPAKFDADEAFTAAPNGAAQPQPSAGQTAQISSDPTPTAQSTLPAVDVTEQPIGERDQPAGRRAPKRPRKSDAERSAKAVKLRRMLREMDASAGSLLASGSSEGSLSTARTRWQTRACQPVRKLRERRIPTPEKAATAPALASGRSEGPRIPIPVKAATAPTSACKARSRPPGFIFT